MLSSEKIVFLSVYVFEVVWGFENNSHQFTCWQWGKGFSQLRQFKDTAKVQTENMLTLLYGWLIGFVIQVSLCGSLSISIVYINELVVIKGAKSKVFKATRSHFGILEASFASG